jgi:nitrogen fixation/metabolism regulation signal transduction histidine kinase
MARSIVIRVFVIFTLCIAVAFSVLTFLIIQREKGLIIEEALKMAEREAISISEALKASMLEGKADSTINFLQYLEARSGTSVMIYSPAGESLFREGERISIPDVVIRDGRQYSHIEKDSVVFYLPLRNEPACRRCHDDNKILRAVVVMNLPVEGLEGSLKGTELRLILYGLLSIIITGILIYLFNQRLIKRPLEHLITGIESVSKGDLSTTLPVKGDDEFSKVAAAFNSMITRLREFQERLEEMVRHRTRELQESRDNLRSLHEDLKRHNEELRRQRDFIETVINSINNGIIVTDIDGRILQANPYTCKFLDRESQELKGRRLGEVFNGLLELKEKGVDEGEIDVGGRKVYIGFKEYPLNSPEGTAGHIILFKDITEIVELKKELDRKKYFSTIGEMASWIAHEVRNPIFAISSVTNIIIKQLHGTEFENFARSILKEVDRINRLVDDLLSYGSPLRLYKKETEMRSYITELSLISDLRIRLELPDKEVNAHIDRERLLQVFRNLLKNAAEADATEVVISLVQENGNIRITLRDNGKGIKQKDISKLFTPFFTTKKTGTGLGLAICKKIVEEHGGTIWVDAEGHPGSTFHISVPVS